METHSPQGECSDPRSTQIDLVLREPRTVFIPRRFTSFPSGPSTTLSVSMQKRNGHRELMDMGPLIISNYNPFLDTKKNQTVILVTQWSL